MSTCKIFVSDSSALSSIVEEKVDLIITSPPYNLNKKYKSYNDTLEYNEYLNFLRNIWKECYNVLLWDGRICLNLPCVYVGKERHFTVGHIASQLEDIGFKYRSNIVWDKGNIHKRTAWGSFKSPSNPILLEPYEFILVYDKHIKRKMGYKEDITKEEFIEWTNSLWKFPGETRDLKHPAPFPEELPKRLIKLYSYPGNTVLDPFMGTGTTCLMAAKLGRNSIGIEIDEDYAQFAYNRIKKEVKDIDIEIIR